MTMNIINRSSFGAPSEIILSTQNGNGSTNTVIRKYSVVEKNVGSDITLTQSATDGDSFTINTDGVYAITLIDGDPGGDNYTLGISRNSNQLTTAIESITSANRLTLYRNDLTDNHVINHFITLPLVDGDIIRAHGNGFTGDIINQEIFKIIKVA